MIAAAETSDMTTAIYSHPDCLRHEMGDWHPESPARLRAIADQLISANVNDLFEHRAAPLVALADLERNHSKNAIAIVRDSLPCDGDDYYPIDGDTSLNRYSWLAAQQGLKQIHTSAALIDYVQALAQASRQNGSFAEGMSPRAAIALLQAARAWAALEGRDHVIPEDVQAMLAPVCAHRLRPLKSAHGTALASRDLVLQLQKSVAV